MKPLRYRHVCSIYVFWSHGRKDCDCARGSVLTEAFSKVLSALQNTPGNKSSRQRDGGSPSAASTSMLNNPSSLRAGTDSDDDSMIDFEPRRPNKKKVALFPVEYLY